MSSITQTLAHSEIPGARTAVSRPLIACVGDGPTGRLAAEIATSLARRLRARLLLATVLQPAPTPLGARLARHGRSLLTNAMHGLDRPAEMLVVVGEPAEQLMMLAQREAAELLVVTTPEPRGSSTQRLGNVYLALAGAGPCPVVIVPGGLEIAPMRGGPIVCGVDGSAASDRAANVAADLAHRLGTRLHLVQGNDLLLEHGPAALRLAAVAEQVCAQLVVAGSSGPGRLARSQLSSVISKLATTAPCPLVIVPPTRGARRLALGEAAYAVASSPLA